MAIGSNSIGHRVTVTGIPGIGFVDTRQNVKKRLEIFRFNNDIPDGDINITYAASSPVNAKNNLFISDKSTSINENSPNFLVEEQTFNGTTFSTFFKNFLLTDVFTPATTTREATPLYFRHILDAEVDENSVTILDQNFNPIDGNLYVVEKPLDFNDDDGLIMDGSDVDHPLTYQGVFVYNNLENTFNAETGEFIVYYVGYADTNGDTVHVLLNNTNVFNEAQFDDIFQLTSQLKPWVKAYEIDENNGVFDITTPTTNLFSLKSLDTARIFVTEPIDKDANLPWFVRITNGSFKFINGVETYVYSLPEFLTQNFNPVFPFKFIISEEAVRVNEHLLKLSRNNINVDPLNSFELDIEIFDADDNILLAITTDVGKDGDTYINNLGDDTTIKWQADQIQSIDKKFGFIYMVPVLKDTYQIRVTYYFEEKFYEFTQVNFNPTQNNEVLNGRVILYLVPTNATNNDNLGHSSALHYLKVAPDGLITFTSQDGTGGNENLKTGDTYMIEAADRRSSTPGGLAHIFWVNRNPQHMGMYYDAVPNAAAGAGQSTVANGAGISHTFQVFPIPGPAPETFVENFTVKAAAGQPGLDKRYLVLAEIFVNEHTFPDLTTLLDTRVKGGGIKQNRIQDALVKNPEVQWYNDIGTFNGRPFPGTSVIIVKIPYTILEEFGGLLTKKQVKQIVRRHMSLGSEPIIRYYGAKPEFTSIIGGNSDSLTVAWPSEGSSYGYNIYYSQNKEGPFIKANTSLLIDNPAGNSLTITGLTDEIAYYITGTAVNLFTNIEGPRSTAIIGRVKLIIRGIEEPLGHTFTVTI